LHFADGGSELEEDVSYVLDVSPFADAEADAIEAGEAPKFFSTADLPAETLCKDVPALTHRLLTLLQNDQVRIVSV
jgi:hypothetical protein